jgi:phospholipid/cholesterol/gamma-HCH transport system substrate-binding protein
MENRPYTLAAGLFVLLALALLAGGILWFNDRGHLRGQAYDLITDSSVAGLTVGANVSLRGVAVGQVENIRFDGDDPSRIRVRISVDPRFVLRKGTYAMLKFQGISGDAYVDLDFPSQEREPLTGNAGAPPQISLRPSAWAALPDTGERFLTTFTSTLGKVDALLTPQNAQQFSHLLVNFSSAATQFGDLAHELRPAARHSQEVVEEADATLRSAHQTLQDVDALVLDVRARIGVLDAVGEGARQTGLAAQDVKQAIVGGSLPKLDLLLQGLSQNSDTLQELLEHIKQQPQSVLFGNPRPPPGPGEGARQTQEVQP